MLNNELLNNELKKSPFTVPGNYFDNLSSKIQDRCIMSKKGPIHEFIPRLAWSGGIMVLMLVLFLSYLNFSKKEQNSDIKGGNIDPTTVDSQEKYLESYRDGMVDYLAVRNINLNDYLAVRNVNLNDYTVSRY
jgi:hypothetical protein